MRSCLLKGKRLWLTLSFAIIALAIKLRYTRLCCNLSPQRADDAPLGSAIGQSTPADAGAAIASSLARGKPAAVACARQVDDSYKLMDCVDEEWPQALHAALGPSALPTAHNEGAIEQAFDMRGLLEKHADGGPIISALVELIQGHYS